MAIDFGGVATTDNHSTAFVPKLNGVLQGLAAMLDPAYVTYTGTPGTGAKRINAGVLEQFNGTSWVAQAWKGAGQFTTLSASGLSTFSGGAGVRGNAAPSSGVGLELLYDGTESVVQSYDRTTPGYKPLWLEASDVRVGINGTRKFTFDSTGLAVTGALSVTSGVTSNQFGYNLASQSFTFDGVANTPYYGVGFGAYGALSGSGITLQGYYGLIFGTTGVARAIIDASGNLGLGVTPSAWRSVYRAFDVGMGSLSGATGSAQIRLHANAYEDSGAVERYRSSDFASKYSQAGGVHYWHTAVSGTAGAAISFTQAMTLDASVLTLAGAVVAAAADSASGGYGFTGFTDYRIWASANNMNFRIGGAGTTFQVTNNGANVVGTLTASKRAYTTSASTSFSATPSFDASASNFHILGALTANVTSVTITSAQEGQFLTIRFTQDATGGRTITTGNMGATNAPSISGSPSTTANKASYLNITYNATAARWEGSWLGTV